MKIRFHLLTVLIFLCTAVCAQEKQDYVLTRIDSLVDNTVYYYEFSRDGKTFKVIDIQDTTYNKNIDCLTPLKVGNLYTIQLNKTIWIDFQGFIIDLLHTRFSDPTKKIIVGGFDEKNRAHSCNCIVKNSICCNASKN